MTDLRKLLDEATPGPWTPAVPFAGSDEYDTGFFISAQHPTVGAVSHASVRYGCDEAKEIGNIAANARLIALAPQLAAALIKAEEALADISGGRPTSAAFSDWHNRYQTLRAYARAALSEIRDLTGGGE